MYIYIGIHAAYLYIYVYCCNSCIVYEATIGIAISYWVFYLNMNNFYWLLIVKQFYDLYGQLSQSKVFH